MDRRETISLFVLVGFSLMSHLLGGLFLYDFLSDEGVWLFDAKNIVLFNSFLFKTPYLTAIAPLNTVIHVFLFKLFGPGIMVGRYASILLSSLTLCIFFSFMRRFFPLRETVFASSIVVVSSLYTMITTTALLEAKIHFFQLLCLFFCFSSSGLFRRLTFIPFSLALGFKLNVFPFIVPLIYAFSIPYAGMSPGERVRKTSVDTVVFCAGSIMMTAAIYLAPWLVDSQRFLRMWSVINADLTVKDPLAMFKDPLHKGFFSTLLYLAKRSPVTTAGFAGGVIAAVCRKNNRPVEIFLLLWIISRFLFFAVEPYVPERYLMDLIFPFSALFGVAIYSRIRGYHRAGLRRFIPAAVLSVITLMQIGSTVYIYAVRNSRHTAKDASRWLVGQALRYPTVIAPAFISIESPGKILYISGDEMVRYRNQFVYPLLYVSHSGDNAAAFMKARVVKEIGALSMYEISQAPDIL